MTQAPCGGDWAGPSPVDRRKDGLKRSTSTDTNGVPLGLVTTGANRHDSPLLAPTLTATIRRVEQVGAGWPCQVTVHLDAGYNSHITSDLLEQPACTGSPAETHGAVSRWQ